MGMDKLYKIDDYESLNQKVYKILKTKIIKEAMKPGTKLSEIAISKGLGVSRTPVREAVQRLIAEGYVKKETNQRIMINKISTCDFVEILQVRTVLEGLSAYLLVKKNNTAAIKELQENIEKMSHLIIKDESDIDIVEFSSLNLKFHHIILDNCGNYYLISTLKALFNRFSMFRSRVLIFPHRVESAFKEHKKIFDAVKKKDAEGAKLQMEAHINHSIDIVLQKQKKSKNKLLKNEPQRLMHKIRVTQIKDKVK